MLKNVLGQGVCAGDRYISDYDKLQESIDALRSIGLTVTMTQGVFDLLHIGHVRYLEEAKSFGDVLVVALDSDEYARSRKQRANERRPVVPFEERLELLLHLRSVTIVVPRDLERHTLDPYHVIKVVRPDVLIMSKSTTDISAQDHRALSEICGKVEILEAKATISTTARLRELLIDGASGLVDHISEAITTYFKQAGREIVFKKGGNNE